MKNKLQLVLLFLITFSLGSCVTFKKSKSKGALSYYESFFINDSTTQFHIKPIEIKEQEETILVDFTFRKSANIGSDVTMNFSVLSKKNIPLQKQIQLLANDSAFQIQNLKLLYKEKKKNQYHYRYNSTIAFENFIYLFKNPNWKMELDKILFAPTKKSEKKLNRINNDLIEFQLEMQ
ncbi:MAG: hypothetical protein PHP99_12230 [Paludibacter sp.]|nr:hypothetical protein [Paludibacter sp.]MDD3489536.1 hypothetical protein [Paludibacter sp.]